MIDDLLRLVELVDRLNKTAVQPAGEARVKREGHGSAVINRMIETGATYGEASGWLPWLAGPDALPKMREVKDDLSAHISMMNHILDFWFLYGEPVPPYYPNRIAIILRKMKRSDLEAGFLRAFSRHFLSSSGGTGYAKLNERVRKLIGNEEADRLEAISRGS